LWLILLAQVEVAVSAMLKSLLNGAGAAVALALLMMALDFYTCPNFEVHHSGAVIISGASTGIGRHAAEELARRGYHVFAGVRNENDAEEVRIMKIETLHPLMLDVTSEMSTVRAVAEVKEFIDARQMPLAAVINNAGIARLQTAEYWDLDDAWKVFDTNLFGTMRLTQLSLPLIRKHKRPYHYDEQCGRIFWCSPVWRLCFF
jgi:NAD(P)-dependent dehydrogenase (short-subunit alcohol dehydrogenase family)